jgi:cell division topological specificity factor
MLLISFLDYFRKSPKPASVAKERLSIIVARERAGTRGRPSEDYLPQLQQELLAVLAKYEKIDLENVSVKLDKSGECDVLELNIILPEDFTPAAAKPPAKLDGRKAAATI